MSPCLSITGGFLLRLGFMAAPNIYKRVLLSQRSDVDSLQHARKVFSERRDGKAFVFQTDVLQI